MADQYGGRIGGGTIASLFESLYKNWIESRQAGLGKLEEVADLYGPGYMAGQERTAIAGAQQAIAGRGLGGTTRPGAVSAGMRAGFEDVRRQGRAGAMTNIANYMAGTAADPGTLAHLATGGFSGMLQERGMGLQTAIAGAPGGPLYTGRSPESRDYMSQIFGQNYQQRLLGVGRGGAPTAPTTPSYTAPGGSYGDMGRVADIQMAPATGQTYYGAASRDAGDEGLSLEELAKKYKVYQAGYTPETLKYRLRQKGVSI